jgi:hypothetical protein
VTTNRLISWLLIYNNAYLVKTNRCEPGFKYQDCSNGMFSRFEWYLMTNCRNAKVSVLTLYVYIYIYFDSTGA